jgi:arabinofuranan 3-O-arabinosyltransferase
VLSLSWGEDRRVRGVRLDIAPDLVATRPLRVTVTVNGRETTDIVSGRGSITVPAQEASALTIRFDNADVVRSLDPDTGNLTALPIGVTEVRILGAEDIVKGPRLIDDAGVPCGFGPELVIDGDVRAETSVTATVSETITDALLRATPCGGRVVTLSQGSHVIEALSTAQYAVEAVALEPVGATPSAAATAPTVQEWDGTHRVIDIPAAQGPRILETTENANAGWRASLGGAELQPIRVDGWRQGWIVPAGVTGTAVLEFAPQSIYLTGLVAGLLAVIALLALAFVRRGRGGTEAPERAPSAHRWLAVGAVVVGLAIGGWPGVIAAAAGVLLAWVVPRPIVAGALACAAALGAALVPWPDSLDAPEALLVATALLAIAALGAAASPGRTPREYAGAPTPGSDAPG